MGEGEVVGGMGDGQTFEELCNPKGNMNGCGIFGVGDPCEQPEEEPECEEL